MKKCKKKMSIHIWKYFTVFSVIIMVTLWILQIILFSTYYETMKSRELASIGNEILASYGSDDFTEQANKIGFIQGVSIGVFDSDINIIHSTDTYNFKNDAPPNARPCRQTEERQNEEPQTGEHQNGNRQNGSRQNGSRQNGSRQNGNRRNEDAQRNDIFNGSRSFKEMDAKKVVEMFEGQKSDSLTFTEKHNNFGKMITYATRKAVDDGYVYVYVKSALPSSNYTIDILRTQLIMVTILSLIIAFILSYFFSKKLTKPIENITKAAERLAEGDYSANFDGGEYFELNRLSNVLNLATEEIKKTEALRNDLMANVSHDLRTPLTIIKSYAEMIRDLSGDNPQKREQHTNVIIKETDRLSLLVTDMLDLSKFESGTHPKNMKEISISELIKSAMLSFQVMTETDGYKIKTDICEDLFVTADERMINQAVYNLVSNAINYTGEDKVVSVKLSKTDDNRARFEVADTGKGISDSEKQFVWDRYYKSSRTHTRDVEGSGLGLSIVKNILEMHNARYGVESVVGKGSVFWFELELNNH